MLQGRSYYDCYQPQIQSKKKNGLSVGDETRILFIEVDLENMCFNVLFDILKGLKDALISEQQCENITKPIHAQSKNLPFCKQSGNIF